MKAVILAGGLGTRLGEETAVRPKPMVEIGGMPIIWHIMKIYSAHGVNDFVICLGYKGYLIKEFFANYFLHTADVTIDIRENTREVHEKRSEPWRITLVETGADTMTGGRLKAVADYLPSDGLSVFQAAGRKPRLATCRLSWPWVSAAQWAGTGQSGSDHPHLPDARLWPSAAVFACQGHFGGLRCQF
jgi:hypothetical protein